jgi:hypothetical protein
MPDPNPDVDMDLDPNLISRPDLDPTKIISIRNITSPQKSENLMFHLYLVWC